VQRGYVKLNHCRRKKKLREKNLHINTLSTMEKRGIIKRKRNEQGFTEIHNMGTSSAPQERTIPVGKNSWERIDHTNWGWKKKDIQKINS